MNSIYAALRHLTLLAVLTTAFTMVGCSDSPTDPDPGGGTGNFTDVPEIPEPQTLGGDVPGSSATLTRIEKLRSTFRPNVVGAYGAWTGEGVCDLTGTPEPLVPVVGWSNQLAFGIGSQQYRQHASVLNGRRIVFLDSEGSATAIRDEHASSGAGAFPCILLETEFLGAPLETPVYLRRDRHWELKALEGGAGDYLLIYPQTEGQVSTSYSSGITRTETEEFGRSLTAEVGLDFKILSARVSGTLSETFSSSLSVSDSKTETFTKIVRGKEGKVLQFMVWELVEVFRFCDAEGNPVVSDNYVFTEDRLVRRGARVALQSTEFDLP